MFGNDMQKHVSRGMAVLVAGCGSGANAYAAAKEAGPDGRVVGTDPDRHLIDIARGKRDPSGLSVAFEVRPVSSICDASDSFDLVLIDAGANLSFNRESILASASRALSPGRRLVGSDLIVADPIANPRKARTLSSQLGFNRVLNQQEYGELLRSLGFEGIDFMVEKRYSATEIVEMASKRGYSERLDGIDVRSFDQVFAQAELTAEKPHR